MVTRPLLSLLLAQTRYFTSISRLVNIQISSWESHAQAISDPTLSALALSKLRSESSHAAAASMLATSVRRPSRSTVVSAIVALELLYDYLDGRTENLPSSPDPLRQGSLLFAPFTGAFAFAPTPANEAGAVPQSATATHQDMDDARYLDALSRAVSDALTLLPASGAVAPVAQLVASRAAQTQIRMHAAPVLGSAQLREWATREARDTTEGGWRELVVSSASSVLTLHCLLAAAADPSTTADDAAQIAEAYSSVCLLLTLLDGVVDHELDAGQRLASASSGDRGRPEKDTGRHGYAGLYSSQQELTAVMVDAARRARTAMPGLPNPSFHSMLLSGVFAYYASSPGASNPFARPIIASVRRELPLMSSALPVMRSWRAARRRFRRASMLETPVPAPSWSPRERSELT